MVYDLAKTKKLIQSHIYDSMFKAYKIFGYDSKKNILYPAFYSPARERIVEPGWFISDRIFGIPNTVWGDDVSIKINKRKYLRVNKGIHFALIKYALRMYGVFSYNVLIPIYVSLLDIVAVESWGRYAVAMKIFIKERDHKRALFCGKKKSEKFEENIERMKMN